MRCSTCGHGNPEGQKFCGECGARLAPAAPSAPAIPTFSADRIQAPQSYTPKHLVDKILTSRHATEGERKQVSVMFCDVAGFTSLTERLDPELVHDIMDSAFEIILGAVHTYEGTINQFLGDGVMALFGAPIAHEDHGHRALRAALAIREGLKPLSAEVRRRHGRDFLMRIGINTGLVVVGAIGRDLRMDYTAVGDTTNLAARLMALAQPGQIVVSRYTQHLRDGFFVFDDLGEFEIKGKTHPVRAYSLVDEIRGQTRLEVSKARGLTPLVGRVGELARLQARYGNAARGQGCTVVVLGEPGVGKSRLLYEFVSRLPAAAISETSCASHGKSIAYHPVLDLLRRHVGITDTMDSTDVIRRVTARLERVAAGDEDAVTTVTHFLGISAPPEFLVRMPPPRLKERTLDLLQRIFLDANEATPAVLVVENVHWIDASSEEFVRMLARGVEGRHVMLVLSGRPSEAPAALGGAGETIVLGGLDERELRDMVLTLVGARAISETLLDTILTRAGGNPLYMEEIVRQLRETGGLIVENDEARLGADDVRVPATIHDIISSRVDRLPDDLKMKLQGAAVIGRRFTPRVLSRVVDDNDALVPDLIELQTRDFIFSLGEDPEPAFAFKHALTQDVVYTGLLDRKRRRYHAAAGAALEELAGDRLQDVVELLAYHYARSEESEKAVDFAIVAAEKAQRRWANSEALAYFETARARLDAMPDSPANRLRRIDTVVKQAEVKFALGRHDEHIHALEGIKPLVEVVEDPSRRAAWYYWAGLLHSLTGSALDVPITYCRTAVRIAQDEGLDDIGAFAQCCLLQVYAVSGDLAASVAAGEQALPAFTKSGNLWWACRTLWGLSMTFNAAGEWGRSLQCCEKAAAHGRLLNDLRLKVVGAWRTGSTHIQRGDAGTGVRYCDEALAMSPSAFDEAMTRAVRALGLVKLGRVEEGIAQLETAMTWFERSNLRYTRSAVSSWLAETYLRSGHGDRALSLAEDLLATSRRMGYRPLEGIALRLRGEALAVADIARAGEDLRCALALLRQVGAMNEMAKTLVAQAELARLSADAAHARRLLTEALAIFETLGTVDEPQRVHSMLSGL
jgi:class 3 adenylate cyclase/tetratricopeptide (TPR) repeat protein